MDISQHTTPEKLERYGFLWSEARLVVAALALFLGGYPPVLYFNPLPALYSPLSSLLTLAWIISGIVSAYLVYQWHKNNQTIFGGKDMKDTIAFFVNIVSGINLGLTGILGENIGMNISSDKVVFMVVGVLYLATAYHLYTRWNAHGQKLF